MGDHTNEAKAHARIAQTYGAYEQSGYAARWRGSTRGDTLMAEERNAWLVTAMDTDARGVIVDVGCGDGNLATTIESHRGRPRRFVGIDLLPDRIQQARTRAPWAHLTVGSAMRLPLADAFADVMIGATLLSSLREPAERVAAAREMARVVKAGGRIVIYDLRYPSPRNSAIRRLTIGELRRLFPGWTLRARALTLLPPLARSALGGGSLRYRILAAVPLLRSHIGVVLERPA